MTSAYRAPAGRAGAELREKGSRFLAVVAPAAAEEEARAVLDELAAAHRDATHHCFAWRLGWPPAERASDAGEPHGTAGQPILRALAAAELSDVVAVVVRWYGGTKLGKGGLARAYAGATREALDRLRVEVRRHRRRWVVTVPYDKVGAVHRLIDPPRVELVGERYGAEAELELAVEVAAEGALEELAAALGAALREGG